MYATQVRVESIKNSPVLQEIFDQIRDAASRGATKIHYKGKGFGENAIRAGMTSQQHDIVNTLKTLGYDLEQVTQVGWFNDCYLKISW